MAAMRISGVILVGLMSWWLSILSAQALPATAVCVEKLVIPQYPISARSAGISATVDVALTWGATGVRWLIESPSPHFKDSVDEALKKSGFAKTCESGMAKITFDFVVSNVRRTNFKQEIVFQPPLRFQIRTDLMELNPSR